MKKPERRDEEGRALVDGPEDVPVFETDMEERAFWLTHVWSPKSWKGAARAARSGSVRERLIKQRH